MKWQCMSVVVALMQWITTVVVTVSVIGQIAVGTTERLHRFHSGVYVNPDEEYAGAFFSSKARFLDSVRGISRAKFPEQIVLNSIKLRDSCEYCENFLTRDYLDFSVEHLSSTTNILNVIPLSNIQKRRIFELLNERLERQVQYLKFSKKRVTPSATTIAVVAFSDNEANVNTNNFEHEHQERLRSVRHNFFKATVYGLLRYFSNIVVYVAKNEDKVKLESWSLPLFQIVDLSETLAAVPKKQYFRDRPVEQLLPKYALLDVAVRMQRAGSPPGLTSFNVSAEKWQSFTSLLYTEGDQILHLRKLNFMYDMFDASNGNFLFVPHRLQTLPLYENFPPEIQKDWSYRKVNKPVSLVTQGFHGGSCCDNGRLHLPNCGNWWYFCDKWGVNNYTTWMKFGEDGFTNALVTEHQGLCKHSRAQSQCPVPPMCGVPDIPAGGGSGTISETEKTAWITRFLHSMKSCPENTYTPSIHQ